LDKQEVSTYPSQGGSSPACVDELRPSTTQLREPALYLLLRSSLSDKEKAALDAAFRNGGR
jgi:hypothetical protein